MITNVAYNNPNVTGIVYVVGFALIGDSLLAISLMSQSWQKIYCSLIVEDLLT